MNWVQAAAEEADADWGPAYGLLATEVSQRHLRHGVEIGVAFAGHSASLLERAECIEKLWSVDPYLHQSGYDDPINVSQIRFDEMYEFARDRLRQFGDRSTLIRATSIEAAEILKGEVDFVYVDAIHTAEALWSDFITWIPRIRLGGLISGHDYGHPNFPGVTSAVNHLIAQTDWLFVSAGEGVWSAERGALDVGTIAPMAREAEGSLFSRLLRRLGGIRP